MYDNIVICPVMMAKKKSKGKGAPNVARKRTSNKSPSNAIYSSSMQIYAIPIILIFTVLCFILRDSDDDNNNVHDMKNNAHDDKLVHHTPHIDGVAIDELDMHRRNITEEFLNSFVCNYKPNESYTTSSANVDIEGYCHPKLSAYHRTQQVSISNLKEDRFWTLQKLLNKVLQYFNKQHAIGDDGIQAGELVMRLPRTLQIWDLDALRDEFIQQEFLGIDSRGSMKSTDAIAAKQSIARHKDTQNPLDSGAYLAVYLIRLMHGAQAKFDDSSNNNEQCQQNEGKECKMVIQWSDVDQHKQRIKLLAPYLDILPTVSDRSSSTQINNPHSHPLFWSLSTIESLFPRYTQTYDLILHYQQMIKSEYEALKLSSDEFGNNVEYLEYLNMRINVLSRAFGVQSTSNDNGAKWSTSGELSLGDEMRSYETSNFGSSLNEDDDEFKLRSMCPLLDMYNSHPNPNVIWRYDSETSAYTIYASDSNVQPGQSIVVSYGKYTDGHLFSKFGYVNGDGSSSTEVSLAVFHRMIADVGLDHQYSQLPLAVWNSTSRDEVFGAVVHADKKMKKSLLSAKQAVNVQAKELIRYLIFDDGYRECIDLNITQGTPEEELKILKLKHLIRLANYRKAWTVIVPPQHPDATPYQTSESSSTRNKKNAVGVNANRIISICRLLSLRVNDIGGDTIAYLREGLTTSDTPYFLPKKHEDTLEYRSMTCVVRLCNVALGRYNGHDNTEPNLVGSAEWNAWYVIIGEIRALRILLQTSASEANRLKHKYQTTKGNINEESMQMRDGAPCPLEYSLPLLERL